MRVLALDTTSEIGSVALVEDDRIVEESIMRSTDGFGHIMFSEIQALLDRNHIRIDQIDLFASASGPGSFTGVRVGLAAIKGLAEAVGRKMLAVSNLEALAWFGTRPLRAVFIDARRGDIFGAVYNSQLEPISEEVVMKLEDWQSTLPADAEIISSGPPLAGAIGRIAAERFHLGKDPAAIDANYVRRSDAEMMWKDSSGR